MNQKKQYHIAIVGATGVVGQKIINVLERKKFPAKSLKLLSSERSAGSVISFRQEDIIVEKATKESFKGVDIAFFSAGGQVSQHLAHEAVQAGAIVIDNTSAFRMDEHVPLIVPEVNESALCSHEGIIANPNCSTIQMVTALAPIKKMFGLDRVVVSTYQSVSGAGLQAVNELEEQVNQYRKNEKMTAETLPTKADKQHYPIAFNVLPQIDLFEENGYTAEEMKMINETKKIFSNPELAITATCVRVPVITSHSESIYIEVNKKGITEADIRHILKQEKSVTLFDEPGNQIYPTPLQATNKDEVFIGRIRKDLDRETGFHLWVVTDNLLKGAALNTVQIAESLVNKNII